MARKAGEKGVGKRLSQELEISILALILCGMVYGRIREPPITVLGGTEISNPSPPL